VSKSKDKKSSIKIYNEKERAQLIAEQNMKVNKEAAEAMSKIAENSKETERKGSEDMGAKNSSSNIKWIAGILIFIALALIPIAYSVGYSNAKSEYVFKFDETSKENDNLKNKLSIFEKDKASKVQLNSTSPNLQSISGVLKKGTKLSWNNDISLTEFDVEPDHVVKLRDCA